MYFKINKETNTFLELDKVFNKMKDCNNAAFELSKELGFDAFGISKGVVAGGISCLQSQEKKEGYTTVGKRHQKLYFPKANNKEVMNKIKELLTVEYDEFNKTIGFVPQYSATTHHRSFGAERLKDIYLIEIDDKCNFKPKSDMIEILSSEFKTLAGNR